MAEAPGGRRRRHRRDPAGRRPELPVEALQRRVDAGERPARDDRRGRPGRRAARRPPPRPGRCPPSSSPGRPSASARRSRPLQEYGISQMPVSEDAEGDAVVGIVGSISEKGLLDRAFRDPSIVERTVGEVMDAPLPLMDASRVARRGVRPAVRRRAGARRGPRRSARPASSRSSTCSSTWRTSATGADSALRPPAGPPATHDLAVSTFAKRDS